MPKNINLDSEKRCIIFEELENYKILELIKDRFYFVSSKNEKPKQIDGVQFFTVDETDTLDLSTIAKSIKKINLILSSPEFTSKVVACWASGSEKRRRNIAVCVGVFAIVYLNKDCAELGRMLGQHSSIRVSEPLIAVQRALHRGFINFHDFNEDIYDDLADVRLHWIVPRKIVGFYGPLYSNNKHYVAPRRYVKYFRQVGVKTVVRVRHLKYDANPFVDVGLDHYDLDMMESVPSDRALSCFLESCEAEPEHAVVVHCRELLGRAGCLVAAYLIKHYAMGADKAMGWIRICTPDCFFESQKAWLKKREKYLKNAGTVYRAERNTYKGEMSSLTGNHGICSYTGLNGASSDLKGAWHSRKITEELDKELEEEVVDYVENNK